MIIQPSRSRVERLVPTADGCRSDRPGLDFVDHFPARGLDPKGIHTSRS